MNTLSLKLKSGKDNMDQEPDQIDMTDEQHIQIATNLVDSGCLAEELARMASLSRHDETVGHIVIGLKLSLILMERFDPDNFREFIEKFADLIDIED